MTATGVCRIWKSSPSDAEVLSGESTIPLSDSMNPHDCVRITNETKNGSSSRNSRLDLCAPPRNAIQYATG